jgi:hypothetical protein
MASSRVVTLKQELSSLSEQERRELSAYLIKLSRETEEWKEESAKRLDEMDNGKKKSTSELRKELGHG